MPFARIATPQWHEYNHYDFSGRKGPLIVAPSPIREFIHGDCKLACVPGGTRLRRR
jgi:hypothetical protein